MKGAYFVGFLQAMPDDLPGDAAANINYENFKEKLLPLVEQDNQPAALLLRVMSAAGQNYLNAIDASLKRPSDQNVVVALFMTIENYFKDICPGFENHRDIDLIKAEAQNKCTQCDEQLAGVKSCVPEADLYLNAMMVLSGYCEELTFPVFGQTDAVGSVMRKRIRHLTDPIKEQIKILRN